MINFVLNVNNRNVSDEELLRDLQKVAEQVGTEHITQEIYDKFGRFSYATLKKRFSGWEKALNLAGLKKNRNYNISDVELFLNLEQLWTHFGRQPKRDDLRETKKSKYSARTYEIRFGSWRKALEAFVEYINQDIDISQTQNDENITNMENEQLLNKVEIVHKTKREVTERMRFRILLRDGFRCKTCGKSPIKDSEIELHVDHIIPWSKGGETTEENLETKCKQCNLGKGNEFNK